MKYCKKCCMPDTRPGIKFDEEGVCSACRSYEHRAKVDWDARWKEFEAICDKYRGMNGPNGYDCMIAVSGGKDSHFQVYLMKELMQVIAKYLFENNEAFKETYKKAINWK